MRNDLAVRCPACASEAVYKYGKAWTGKQRFKCLMCGRQFTSAIPRYQTRVKPDCPTCGKHMQVYKRETHFVRFRCSDYPSCKTYRKLPVEMRTR